jgi:hypothetical protein
MRWERGNAIVERSIWFGSPVAAMPLTVVADTDEVLAASLTIGTQWFGPIFTDRADAVEEFARGEVQWGPKTWIQHNVLKLVREGDAYSAQAFFNEAGDFVCWYINLQEPMRRSEIGFDTRDNSLDILVGRDLSWWQWKDLEETERAVDIGLYTRDEVDRIKRQGEDVVRLVESGHAWWTAWDDWAPDPAQPVPVLPPTWNTL